MSERISGSMRPVRDPEAEVARLAGQRKGLQHVLCDEVHLIDVPPGVPVNVSPGAHVGATGRMVRITVTSNAEPPDGVPVSLGTALAYVVRTQCYPEPASSPDFGQMPAGPSA